MGKILGEEAYEAASLATIKKLSLLRQVVAESSKNKEKTTSSNKKTAKGNPQDRGK